MQPLGSLVAWVLREVARALLGIGSYYYHERKSRHGRHLLVVGKVVNFRWLITLLKLVGITMREPINASYKIGLAII